MTILSANNLGQLFVERVKINPDRTAYLRKKEGAWVSATWQQFEQSVFEIARAMTHSQLKRGERVALLSQTRPEWTCCDLAALSLGAVSVPIYPSVTADEVFFILEQSQASLLIVEDSVQREKVRPLLVRLPHLKTIVSLDGYTDEVFQAFGAWTRQGTLDLAAWRQGTTLSQPDELATLVYTSGTTGLPKGAELSHGNFLSMLGDCLKILDLYESDSTLLFLPTAHILGRVEQMLLIGVGWTTAYAESMAGLMDNMHELRPTILVSVPRIYEKFYAAIQSKFTSGSAQQRWIFNRALEIGRAYSRVLQQGERPSVFLRLQYQMADRMIFQKVREKFGGKLRFTVSGGAPLGRDIAEFFHACGILILEGYGLTETTGPIAVNRPGDFKFGSVGKLMPDAELKIAEDGEILIRGGSVSKGYYRNEATTAEAFQDGFFATGDVGLVDEDGFLKITDRKKDLLITAGGKNIAPQKIENLFKANPLFANAVVFGDREKYLVALLCFNLGEFRRSLQRLNIAFTTVDEALQQDVVRRYVKSQFDEVNKPLASYERIKKYRILPRDLSLEAGELTPSLKVKRKFCAQKYADLIQQMYE